MLFKIFIVKLDMSKTGVTPSSKISISTISVSISISQLIFIDISISAISMTALIVGGLLMSAQNKGFYGEISKSIP